MAIIEIHEFSTGINVQGTPEKWHSTGFSGHYINSTLSKIPEAVRSAIRYDLFSLSESAIQKTAAIIGREVRDENEQWSVLAVITNENDESARRIVVTRYFLTEELGNLSELLNWYNIKSLNGKLVFNPFDVKQEGEVYHYETKNITNHNVLTNFQGVLNQKILPRDRNYTPFIINQLATQKRQDNQLITWAYNVEGLRKPHDFQVIYPASEEAARIIEQDLNRSIVKLSAVSGEEKIYPIINNWIYQGTLKLGDVQTINNALANPLYNEEFWSQSIFKRLGIEDIKDSYAPHLVLLYMLYGLILEQKLPDFLDWFYQKQETNKKPEHYQIAQNFSKTIQDNLCVESSEIKEQAFKGINLIISGLVSSNNLKNLLKNWLILDQKGLWGKAYETYKVALWKDLKQIAQDFQADRDNLKKRLSDPKPSQNTTQVTEEKINKELIKQAQNYPYEPQNLRILNTQPWTDIRKDIIAFIRYQDYKPNKNYLPLAEFFAEIAENDQDETNYFLSAFFSQMAEGDVPMALWKKCGFDPKTKKAILSKLISFKRRLTPKEKFSKNANIALNKVSHLLFIPQKVSLFNLVVLTLTIGIISSIITDILNLHPGGFLKAPVSSGSRDNPHQQAKKELSKDTIFAIYKIITDNSSDAKKIQQTIIKLIEPSSSRKLDFNKINTDQQNWLEAIKEYQGKYLKSIQATGTIKTGDDTDKLLRCQLKQELKKPLDNCKVTLSPSPSPSPTKTPTQEDKDWGTTVKALDALRDELLKTDSNLTQKRVEEAISTVLTVDITFPDINKPDKANQKLWIQKIKEFQGKNSIGSTGMIVKGNTTYNRLKCEVAQELNPDPSNKCE